MVMPFRKYRRAEGVCERAVIFCAFIGGALGAGWTEDGPVQRGADRVQMCVNS